MVQVRISGLAGVVDDTRTEQHGIKASPLYGGMCLHSSLGGRLCGTSFTHLVIDDGPRKVDVSITAVQIIVGSP